MHTLTSQREMLSICWRISKTIATESFFAFLATYRRQEKRSIGEDDKSFQALLEPLEYSSCFVFLPFLAVVEGTGKRRVR